MDITEVRVKLMRGGTGNDKLRAFCSVTLDNDFVVRDLKIIEGTNGMFVAMPSRKVTDRCPKCRTKNSVTAKFCSECGLRLPVNRARKDARGMAKIHADIAHPINARFRELLQTKIIGEYEDELARANRPDYRPKPLSDDYDFETVNARAV